MTDAKCVIYVKNAKQVGLSRATLESQVKVFLFGPIGLAVYVSKGLVINLINHPTLQKILLLY